MRDEVAAWTTTTIEVVPGASHFFVGRTDRLVAATERFLGALVVLMNALGDGQHRRRGDRAVAFEEEEPSAVRAPGAIPPGPSACHGVPTAASATNRSGGPRAKVGAGVAGAGTSGSGPARTASTVAATPSSTVPAIPTHRRRAVLVSRPGRGGGAACCRSAPPPRISGPDTARA